MEWHIKCDEKDIARYIFCPGDHARAKKIADFFEKPELVCDSRGYVVYSGMYRDTFMTACGTGMGGPMLAIALEELSHMGADTFIRVGSCGVFQEGQKPGDLIISSGTVRGGGTGTGYLPLMFPAVPTFSILRQLVESAEELKLQHIVGVGIAGDVFYYPHEGYGNEYQDMIMKTGLVSLEMESDTLFIAGNYRGWRTGAIFTSDGGPGAIKPDWGKANFCKGEQNAIKIALHAMSKIAGKDRKK